MAQEDKDADQAEADGGGKVHPTDDASFATTTQGEMDPSFASAAPGAPAPSPSASEYVIAKPKAGTGNDSGVTWG